MIKSGFFNSKNGDRVYPASELNNFVDGLLGDGVFKNYDSALKVNASSGMYVSVSGGKAIIKGYYVYNTSSLTIPIDSADTLARKDIVVVGVDTSTEVRAGNIYVVKGTPSATPVAPEPVRTATKNELVIAEISVPAGAVSIPTENITDKRGNESVCGYVRLTDISATVKEYNQISTVTPSQMSDPSVIPITIAEYEAGSDLIEVALNGVRLLQDTDFSVQLVSGTECVVLANALYGDTAQRVEVTVTQLQI